MALATYCQARNIYISPTGRDVQVYDHDTQYRF